MQTGICKLCLKLRQLCNSHALPNSIFKYILRKNNGKAVILTDDETTPIEFSSDTWGAELLCVECEKKLNEKYDAYGIAVFRGHAGKTNVEIGGICFSQIDRRRLRMFFLSILWRVSVSTHPSYWNGTLSSVWEEDLRHSLNFSNPIPQIRYTVFVRKMRDSTPKDGFDTESIREIICSPISRQYKSIFSVCFTLLGYFVEIFIPRVSHQLSKKEGMLYGRANTFLAPYIEILEIPEMMQLFIRGVMKDVSGLSKVA